MPLVRVISRQKRCSHFNWTCFSGNQHSGHPDMSWISNSSPRETHMRFWDDLSLVCEQKLADGLVFLSLTCFCWSQHCCFSRWSLSSVIQMSIFIFMKIKPLYHVCVLCSWRLHLHTVAFDKPAQSCFDLLVSISLCLFCFFPFLWCFSSAEINVFPLIEVFDCTSVQPLWLNELFLYLDRHTLSTLFASGLLLNRVCFAFSSTYYNWRSRLKHNRCLMDSEMCPYRVMAWKILLSLTSY